MLIMIGCFLKADLRQKNLMFWDWVFPFVLMIGAAFFVGDTPGATEILGGLIGFLMLQSLIYGLPFRICEYKEKGTLQLFAEEGDMKNFIGQFLLTRILIVVIQCGIFIPVGAVVMNTVLDIDFLLLAMAIIAGLFVFGGISLLIAAVVDKQQSALGCSQLIYLVLTITSGIFYPLERSPKLLQVIGRYSPLTHIKSLLFNALSGGNGGISYIEINIVLLSVGMLLITGSIFLINKKLANRINVL